MHFSFSHSLMLDRRRLRMNPIRNYSATYTCMQRSCKTLDFTTINTQKGERKACPSCGKIYSPTVEVSYQ